MSNVAVKCLNESTLLWKRNQFGLNRMFDILNKFCMLHMLIMLTMLTNLCRFFCLCEILLYCIGVLYRYIFKEISQTLCLSPNKIDECDHVTLSLSCIACTSTPSPAVGKLAWIWNHAGDRFMNTIYIYVNNTELVNLSCPWSYWMNE